MTSTTTPPCTDLPLLLSSLETSSHLEIRLAAEACKVVGQLDEVGQQACIGLPAAPSALCRQGVAIGEALQQAGHATHNAPQLHRSILAGRPSALPSPRARRSSSGMGLSVPADEVKVVVLASKPLWRKKKKSHIMSLAASTDGMLQQRLSSAASQHDS